jgi:DNA-binding SARP family transcriptional activator
VLGPLQMTVDGAPVSLGTPKQRVALAVLLMNRNRPVGIASLITAAWQHWPPSEARASLHSYISNLRTLLAGAGADARSALVNAPPGLRSATGVDVGGERIRGTETLSDGDRIRICAHELTFEIHARKP